MAKLVDEGAEERAKLVEAVTQRFADHGADRAALLTVAFFLSEVAVEIEGVQVRIEMKERP